MKYFVSYTTRDKEVTIDLLKSFAKRLRYYGEVFVDLIDNNSLNKQDRVISELDSSDLMVLIESKNIYNSEWVVLEIERAKAKNIPIRKLKISDLGSFSGSFPSLPQA